MLGALSLAGVALAQRVARRCAEAAGVWWCQRVEWCGGPWCAKPDGVDFGAPLHTLLWLESAFLRTETSLPERVRLVRVGAFVAAVAWAPDGGGTTRVFLASNELKGDGAAEMWRWHEARERRSAAEMEALICGGA